MISFVLHKISIAHFTFESTDNSKMKILLVGFIFFKRELINVVSWFCFCFVSWFKIFVTCRFVLTPYMMTPIADPQNNADERYNRAHKRTRAIIERCFGLTKHRFRCLHKSGGAMTYAPEKCCKIIMACLILHNMCVNAGVALDDEDQIDDDDNEEDDDVDNNENDEQENVRQIRGKCKAEKS